MMAPMGYRPPAGGYDEMVWPNGELRSHWRVFASLLEQCTAQDLNARVETVQRLLRDHGVNYNTYDDALGTSRPWALDLIPFIVEAKEASIVAEGLEQRARLLDAILADIYGPQSLIKEGWLPPALLAANPAFLRPVVGIVPAGGRFLRNAGCDLVRLADGSWRVLADRTEAISGQGYALENRIILSSVFAEEFNASHAQRLAEYFEAERESLRALTTGDRNGMSIAMLAPGPQDDTYFEHAFKARYLGLPLIQSADLTVRDRRLNLKTLEGLRPVEVLIRRVADRDCDPLELHGDPLAGIPGFVEAWRSGCVAISNGIGSGVVGTPALHPFMPNICRHLLSEELKIPCVPTWWCGQPSELNMVLAQPERWVIKEAFVRGARDPIFLESLDAAARSRMLDQIKASPHLYIAQESLQLSTTPTWINDRLEARPVVWRNFAMAVGDGYTVMPGGLSRVSSGANFSVVTMRSGGISKDTWALTDGPVVRKSLLNEQPITINSARAPSAVPSRLADHLFWLGRYAERIERTARIARSALQRMGGEGTTVQVRELQGCANIMGALQLIPKGELLSKLRPGLQDIVHGNTCDQALPRLISSLRFNAAAARDRLSDDSWLIFNRIERDASPPRGTPTVPSMLGVIDTLVLDLAAFSGVQNENMTHGHGWRFLMVGRRIERALLVAELVSAAVEAAATDDVVLTPLLEICDSTMTYRRLHFSRPQVVPAAYLLMQDASNPRSIAYQLDHLGTLLAQLPRDADRGDEHAFLDHSAAAAAELASIDWQGALRAPESAFAMLPVVCTRLITHLEALAFGISEHYFSHAARRVR